MNQAAQGVNHVDQIAQAVNAFAVVVLVVVTSYYAWTTRKILGESKKMREAAERQAASAAAQASTASATLGHLREQVEDLQHQGASIVKLTIDKLVRAVDDWKKLDIKTNYINAGAFPSPDNLVPRDDQGVLEHARRVSDNCANLLNDAFNDLRSAHSQISVLIQSRQSQSTMPTFFDSAKYDPNPYLTSAFEKLQSARAELHKATSGL